MRNVQLRLLSLALPAVVIAVASCAGNQPGVQVVVAESPGTVPPPPTRAIPCAQQRRVSPVVQIGSNGGYVSVGRHLLSVPPGSLSSDIKFQMVQPQANYVVVQVGPHGTSFIRSTYLILSTAGCDLPDPSTPVKLVRWDGSSWVDVPPARMELHPREDQRGLEVTAAGRLDHLSSYALASP